VTANSESLAELVAPGRCAVLVMELQRGVVGDFASMPILAKAVQESGVIAATARVLGAARAAGVRVIHCHAAFRADRAGTPRNVPLVNGLLRNPRHMRVGEPSTESVPELGPDPRDLVSQRFHGMSPFAATELDAFLRAEGASCVVATGVSLNVGIIGLTIEAVNHGYHVVIPRDCVAGYPAEYGEAVLANTLSRLAHFTTSEELVARWSR
jgi:nicotinamidase-related amidase